MAKYIDADKLIEDILSIRVEIVGGRAVGKTIFREALSSYRDKVLELAKEAPTADVVPRSEYKKLQDRLNRLKKYDEERDIALHQRLVKEAKTEGAKEIIDKVDDILWNYKRSGMPINLDNIHRDIIDLIKNYKGDRSDNGREQS